MDGSLVGFVGGMVLAAAFAFVCERGFVRNALCQIVVSPVASNPPRDSEDDSAHASPSSDDHVVSGGAPASPAHSRATVGVS